MKILAFFIFTCAAVPSHWCAPVVEDPDALDEETLNGVLDDKPSDGVHGHADPYRGGRDFNNNDFDVGDISVSGHVKGDDVSIGSSIDIQVGESISEPLLTSSISEPLPTGANLDPLPTGANLDPLSTGANLDPLPSGPNLESLPSVAVWESHNVGILEPLPALPEQDGIQNEMQSSPGSCDQDACNIGVSVGAGVCSVAAGVGGAAVAATTCAATAWFTFGLSCAVAGIVYTAAGAACGVAGELGSQACDACAEVDFKDIAESIESNHLEQMEWFEKLDKNNKEIVKNQEKMIELQQMGIGKMDDVIKQNEEMKSTMDLTRFLVLYADDVKHLSNVFEKFNFLNRGPSGIIEHDQRAETFRDAALDPVDGLESLIKNIFMMLIGGQDMAADAFPSIYKDLKDDGYCSMEYHEYFLRTLMEAFMMMTTAMAMRGDPLSSLAQYNYAFNQRVVKATTVFVQNCGCPPGYIRSNRGELSTLLDELPQSNVKLEENRRKVMKIDDKAMRLKMNRIFEVKNFEPNQIAMSRLKMHTVEDIELVVGIMKDQNKTETQIHDYAVVCVDEELNKEKTYVAFTPDSILTTLSTSCAPPPTLSNGQFLCLNDSFCYAVCDQGYYIPENTATADRFIMCVGRTWTPLPTTYQCKPAFAKCFGRNMDCCTPSSPCPENHGDCDNDSHCAGSLVCGQNNCNWMGANSAADCCVEPGSKGIVEVRFSTENQAGSSGDHYLHIKQGGSSCKTAMISDGPSAGDLEITRNCKRLDMNLCVHFQFENTSRDSSQVWRVTFEQDGRKLRLTYKTKDGQGWWRKGDTRWNKACPV